MTTAQRIIIPESIRTNGATPNPWWANAVVYQIYPRSFQDTNGDGFGDIPGITSRLGYLADLGVDVIWLSPVYKSPQDDNGYDISDYQNIDPLFGTLDDMDELISAAHARGIKIVMDLVVNHTSDEHDWFQTSRDPADEHSDWYWWRPARPGHTPGTPGAEPNQWGSYFGGSAWQYDSQRGEYYFHQFSKKQPDLNWENPAMRQAVYRMMNWWMDRGIDGFRMDVIVLISKFLDANGRLPGEEGSGLADGPVEDEGYSNPQPFCCDGPHLDEYLAEMRREVFEGREGYLTVGEAPGLPVARTREITDPASAELDMLFLFDHMGIDQNGSKWNVMPFDPAKLRAVMGVQQQAVADAGWASLYFDNHDQPRVVSRWGDTSSDELRIRSAKALALLLHMHRGTPYIYQGEELGMTNAGFTELEQYRDLESINLYHQRVDEAKVQSSESMLAALAIMGRDNARTPMQWDATAYAGFTEPDASQVPWIAVNPNCVAINAESEQGDPDSVYAFYRKLIRLRHENPVIAAGDWRPLDAHGDRVYAFTRSVAYAGDAANGIDVASHGGRRDDAPASQPPLRRILVVANLSSTHVAVPAETAALLGVRGAGPDRITGAAVEMGGAPASRAAGSADGCVDADIIKAANVLIGTYAPEQTVASLRAGELAPWEAFAYRID